MSAWRASVCVRVRVRVRVCARARTHPLSLRLRDGVAGVDPHALVEPTIITIAVTLPLGGIYKKVPAREGSLLLYCSLTLFRVGCY